MTDLAIFLQREKDRLQKELEAVKDDRSHDEIDHANNKAEIKSLQIELEAVKAENEKLMADVRTCIAEYFRPLDDKGLGILYKLLKGR